MKTFANTLKELRRQWNWSQDDLANVSNIPLKTIQNYEQDRNGRIPTFYNVMILANVFDVTPYYLYYGGNEEMKIHAEYTNELVAELKQLSVDQLKQIHDSQLQGVSLPKLSVSPEVIETLKAKFNQGVVLPERGMTRPYIEQILTRYAQNRQVWKQTFGIKTPIE